MGKRIGILGGTFDPVHTGHLKIVESFLNSNLIDEIQVYVAPGPPHKQKRSLTPFRHRFEMAKIAFSDFNDVLVSDLENRLPKPSYTVHTLEYLKKKYPDDHYYLCLGEDNIQIFKTWYKYREILEMVTLLVAERPGFDSSGVESEILNKTIFADHEPIEVSSSAIRKFENREMIPEKVQEYIKKHGLYKNRHDARSISKS